MKNSSSNEEKRPDWFINRVKVYTLPINNCNLRREKRRKYKLYSTQQRATYFSILFDEKKKQPPFAGENVILIKTICKVQIYYPRNDTLFMNERYSKARIYFSQWPNEWKLRFCLSMLFNLFDGTCDKYYSIMSQLLRMSILLNIAHQCGINKSREEVYQKRKNIIQMYWTGRSREQIKFLHPLFFFFSWDFESNQQVHQVKTFFRELD